MHVQQISVAQNQGNRSYMEDYSVHVTFDDGSLFAVFDGHGGHETAQQASYAFPSYFKEAMDQQNRDIPLALRNTIIKLERDTRYMNSGSTLSAVYLPFEKDVAYTAVLGDSPILIGCDKGYWTSPKHNVRTNKPEADAARARGGFIDGGYLFTSLDGPGLQMTRSLGDKALDRVLSREPEQDTVKVLRGGYVLVATDGLFDPGHKDFLASADLIVDLIRDPNTTAQELVEDALRRRTGDNVTAILVRL